MPTSVRYGEPYDDSEPRDDVLETTVIEREPGGPPAFPRRDTVPARPGRRTGPASAEVASTSRLSGR